MVQIRATQRLRPGSGKLHSCVPRVETVRKERDEAMQRQHTVERERDAARRQSDDCTRRYQQDMHAARGRIGELEEQVRRQGVLIGLAGLGLVGAWVWKLR